MAPPRKQAETIPLFPPSGSHLSLLSGHQRARHFFTTIRNIPIILPRQHNLKNPSKLMKNMPITVILLLAAATLAFSPSSAGEPAGAVPPDFTAGGKKDDSHDWLLGPTGLRGWMFIRHEDLTASSRQILVTAVDKGSPADGMVQVNDVILGVCLLATTGSSSMSGGTSMTGVGGDGKP